ncbi:DUF3795 domain-containing protein [Candidatus Bathyarchaeota archaeon]|nr:DUF3795 domain-containing protein [Candidatus Bathyarchaeota archaeon]
MNGEDSLGFCGLVCTRCAFYLEGEIGSTARLLRDRLQDYERYTPRMETRFPVLDEYPGFQQVLSWFASRDCVGCRSGGGLTTCGIRDCCVERGLQHCYMCGEFPCDRLQGDMITNSYRLREAGVERFLEEEKSEAGLG